MNSLTLLKTCGKIYKYLIVVRQCYNNYILDSCSMCPWFFYIMSIYFKYNTMFFYFISLKMCEWERHRNSGCRFALFLLSLLSFWLLHQSKFTCFVFFLCYQAFSAFFFIHSFLQQVTGITVNTPSQLEDATRTVCTMTYSQVVILCYGFVQYTVNHLYCAIYCISMHICSL